MFSALVVLGGGAFLLLRGADTGARTARISLDGEVYEEIDLNAVAMPYDIRIETELGYNIVHVEHGAISVSEAGLPGPGLRAPGEDNRLHGAHRLPAAPAGHRDSGG